LLQQGRRHGVDLPLCRLWQHRGARLQALPQVSFVERGECRQRLDRLGALRLPRISLAGSLSRAQTRFEGASLTGNLWTVGPLQVSVPLFDAGRRSANVDAARAAYEAATLTYQHQLRKAVREVEDALLRLDSGTRRQADLQRAATGFERVMQATRSRQMAGLASALDAEDARRNWLQAQRAHLDAQREQAAAWIALYRALGGGWSAETALNVSPNASAPPAPLNTASTGAAL